VVQLNATPGHQASRGEARPESLIIRRAAVIGSGYMGGGIAQVLAIAGLSVALADLTADDAARARDRLVGQARQFESDRLIPAGAADAVAARLTAAGSLEEAVADADYVTEAVSESAPVKHKVLRRIAAAARPDVVITTNTSSIPIRSLADVVSRPERFLGVHWMNPAPFVPAVEVIPGERTSAAVVGVVLALLRRAGKRPVTVGDAAGFVVNRLQFALFREAAAVVAEGLATPAEVDLLVSGSFGFRLPVLGPFAVADMAGLDVYAGAYQMLEQAYGERLSAPESLKELVSAGDFGAKSGKGFTSIDGRTAEAVAAWRDRAYVALAQALADVGPPPGGHPAEAGPADGGHTHQQTS
jgi:3-hydroxybutyryl-CoA dehydrogenase